MKRILIKALTVIGFLTLASCGTYFNQPFDVQEARLGETTDITERLINLALPKEPVVVGVYKFRDQTGQYKPSETGGSFSTAVTQGATTILIKALEDSKWFVPIERENLANLLNERNIIRSTRQEYRKTSNPDEPQLPPLLYAGIILDGGIVSYDTNIVTGGLGARYFGIGAATQYRQDRITVYLRAVSTSSGKILKTVYVSKTILSQSLDASLFKYVSFKRLLEVETGFTKNEPIQLAVKEAIEKAVESLIIEGIDEKLWSPQASEAEAAALIYDYELEKEEAISTELYDRFLTKRRGKDAVIGALGFSLMNGDYADAELDFNTKIGYKHFVEPYLNLNFTFNKFNLANKDVFSEGFMSFDLNAEVNILPNDKLTPYAFAGFGANTTNYFKASNPKIQAGIGFEYLITNNIGFTFYGEHNLVFSDKIDGIEYGKRDDMYYRFGAGVNIYFTQPKTKFNEDRRQERQRQKELNELKRLNTKALKENRTAKPIEPKSESKSEPESKSEVVDVDSLKKEKKERKEQKKLNKKTLKANKKAKREAERNIKAAQKKEEKTIINTNKIENDEN